MATQTVSPQQVVHDPDYAGLSSADKDALWGAVVPEYGGLSAGERRSFLSAVESHFAKPRFTGNELGTPGIPRPAVPDELQVKPWDVHDPLDYNSKTGGYSPQAPYGSVHVLDAPKIGSEQIAAGLNTLKEPIQAMQPGQPGSFTPKMGNQMATGASQVLGGAFELASPLMVGAAVAAPVAAAESLATAVAAGHVSQKTADVLGASPEVSKLVGEVGSLVGGGLSIRHTLNAADAAAGKLAKTIDTFDIPAAEKEAFIRGQFEGQKFPVMADGKPHVVETKYVPEEGKLGIEITDANTGKPTFKGTAKGAEDWLGIHADEHTVEQVPVTIKDASGKVIAEETLNPDEASLIKDIVAKQKPDHTIEIGKKQTVPNPESPVAPREQTAVAEPATPVEPATTPVAPTVAENATVQPEAQPAKSGLDTTQIRAVGSSADSFERWLSDHGLDFSRNDTVGGSIYFDVETPQGTKTVRFADHAQPTVESGNSERPVGGYDISTGVRNLAADYSVDPSGLSPSEAISSITRDIGGKPEADRLADAITKSRESERSERARKQSSPEAIGRKIASLDSDINRIAGDVTFWRANGLEGRAAEGERVISDLTVKRDALKPATPAKGGPSLASPKAQPAQEGVIQPISSPAVAPTEAAGAPSLDLSTPPEIGKPAARQEVVASPSPDLAASAEVGAKAEPIFERLTPRQGTPERTRLEEGQSKLSADSDAIVEKVTELSRQRDNAKLYSKTREALIVKIDKLRKQQEPILSALKRIQPELRSARIEDAVEQTENPILREAANYDLNPGQKYADVKARVARLIEDHIPSAQKSADQKYIDALTPEENAAAIKRAADRSATDFLTYPLTASDAKLDQRINGYVYAERMDVLREKALTQYGDIEKRGKESGGLLAGGKYDRFRNDIRNANQPEDLTRTLADATQYVDELVGRQKAIEADQRKAVELLSQRVRPLSEMEVPAINEKVTTGKVWNGNSVNAGRFVSDGSAIIDGTAIKEKGKTAQLSKTATSGVKNDQTTAKKLFDQTATSAKTKLEEIGHVSQNGEEIALYAKPDGTIISLSAKKIRFLQNALKFDEVRGSVPLKPVALYRDGKMVTVLAPFKLNGDIDLNIARESAKAPAPAESTGQIRQFARVEEPSRLTPADQPIIPPEPSATVRRFQKAVAASDKATGGAVVTIGEELSTPLHDAARAIREGVRDVVRLLVPAAVDANAKHAALTLRKNTAQSALDMDRAHHALRRARKFFQRKPEAYGFEFIRKMQAGESQASAAEQAFSDAIEKLFREAREMVQQLGTGKLQKFYEHYFPGIWKDRKRAETVFADWYSGQRKFEGKKAFLKKKKYPTFQDGLDAGLIPVSPNPVDLTLLKLQEMYKYILAHRSLNEWKQDGTAVYYDERTAKPPAGWEKIADPIGTVYGQSVQQIEEFPNAGLWDGLNNTMSALGLKHERKMRLSGGDLGQSPAGKEVIRTAHGTNESIVAHEIGHVIEDKWHFIHSLWNFPGGDVDKRLRFLAMALSPKSKMSEASRAKFQSEFDKLSEIVAQRNLYRSELTALADLRSDQPADYRRDRDEMAAAAVQAWVGSREKFEQAAPNVMGAFKAFMEEHSELEPLLHIEGNMRYETVKTPLDVGGMVIKGHYWAPKGAALILNNYLSPGLRTKSGIYRGLLWVNNNLNMFQLGFSAFHLGFTTIDAMTSRAALGTEMVLRGEPLRGLGTIASFPLSAVTNIMKGHVVMKARLEGTDDPRIQAVIDASVLAGARASMDTMYQTRMAQRWMDTFHEIWTALQEAQVGRAAVKLVKLGVQSPFALADAAMWPILQWLVPRQKLGVFYDKARYDLERLGPDATPEQMQQVLANAWDSVDNRLGQLVYDNLYWNRTLKDILMLNTRSVGWNLGSIREIAGAGGDVGGVPLQLASGTPYKFVNLNRLSYVIALVGIVAPVIGAIYQYIRTGKGPQESKDYYFPKNGEVDDKGRPLRTAPPTYVKDIYHYRTDPWGTLANKVSPLDRLVWEQIQNQDWQHTEIRNPHDPLVKRMEQAATYALKAHQSFGTRNWQRMSESGAPTSLKIEPFFGFTPAARSISLTPAEELAEQYMKAREKQTQTPEQAERRHLKNLASRAIAQGKDIPAQVQEGLDKGQVSFQDLHDAMKQGVGGKTALQRDFHLLAPEDALAVWNVASSEERGQLQIELQKMIYSEMRKPPIERDRVVPLLQKALTSK